MEPLIISNNPLVKSKYPGALFVCGGFGEVLCKVRDLIHLGHKLISHPLGSSIRMIYSPYRSVVVSSVADSFCEEHCKIIESSIEGYRAAMGGRRSDYPNHKDYQFMDLELLESSLKEATLNYL